jgi:nucleoside-diphosphate-sugar epimerase
MKTTALVTGGAGYFGEELATLLLDRGYRVRVFDLHPSALKGVDTIQGDIRSPEAVLAAMAGIDVVYHNVAQVPLARDHRLFWSVNRDGTRTALEMARAAGIRKFVYTSSSAVFGIPRSNPVTEETEPTPAENYGQAKLAGEVLCREAHRDGLDVTIIRPRTIIGHGRLGVVELLFDWVYRGLDVPVFDGGNNVYQFVHADDLASACIAAGERSGFAIYNVGCTKFGTMRQLLEAIIGHARSGSRIRSVPMTIAEMMMNAASAVGLSPLGPYHALMYGRSLYFDTSKVRRELGWEPKWSQEAALCQSYDWYLQHRGSLNDGNGKSHHQTAIKRNILSIVPYVLSVFPTIS